MSELANFLEETRRETVGNLTIGEWNRQWIKSAWTLAKARRRGSSDASFLARMGARAAAFTALQSGRILIRYACPTWPEVRPIPDGCQIRKCGCKARLVVNSAHLAQAQRDKDSGNNVAHMFLCSDCHDACWDVAASPKVKPSRPWKFSKWRPFGAGAISTLATEVKERIGE